MADNAVVLSVGEANQSGTRDELYLDKYSGIVIAEFSASVKVAPMFEMTSLSSGKDSISYKIGKRTGQYISTPGTELLGTDSNFNKIAVSLDSSFVDDAFLSYEDLEQSDYDPIPPVMEEIGKALARNMEAQALRMLAVTARDATPTITGDEAGTQITAAQAKTNGNVLANAILDARVALEEQDVMDEDVYAVISPTQAGLLYSNPNFVNVQTGGEGSIARGEIGMLYGVRIIKSNLLPTANDSSNTAIPSKYRANFTNSAGLVFTKDAIKGVKSRDLTLDTDHQINRRGHLIIGSTRFGWGSFRKESVVEIVTS